MSTESAGSLGQVSRLLTLVPLLHSRDAVRLDEAARLLGVTPDQVRKDLHVLFMCGTPGGLPDDLIDVDVEALEASDGVIRVSNADYLSRPLRLTPVEASALLVALRVLRDQSDALPAEVVERTIAKLEVAAGGDADRVAVEDPAAEPSSPQARRRLGAALDEGRQVRLTYHVPSRDEDTERVVDPHALVDVKGVPYLHAWCHRAEARRFFRLDRIRSLDVLDTPVASEPDVPDLGAGFFAADPRAAEVTLRLAPEAAWVPEYYDVTPGRRLDDGSQEVSLHVGDPQWLERLLLRLAPHAQVVGPQEFADTFRARARAALGLYE